MSFINSIHWSTLALHYVDKLKKRKRKRNLKVLKGIPLNPMHANMKVKNDVQRTFSMDNMSSISKQSKLMHWLFPICKIELNTYGCSKGNPG